MNISHVVIGGGTGYIGSALVQVLREKGARVTIICREQRRLDQISWQSVASTGLPKDTTHVINVAGQNILDPRKRWTESFKNAVWDSRITTTKTLARAISNSDVKCFATISGVAYYKPGEKEWTEDDTCEKYDYLSELTHHWEEAAELPRDSKCRRVTIRSGVVLGRTGGMVGQMFIPFFLGLGGHIGSGKQYMPWIHISDLVYLFITALENPIYRGVLNGVAPQVITNKEFTKTFARAMWKPALIPIPTLALNLLFNKERAKIMTDGQKVIPKRVLEYGYEYDYPSIKLACDQFSELMYTDHF